VRTVRSVLAVAAVFLTATGAAAAGPPPHQGQTDPGKGAPDLRIDAGCAGDTINGTVSMFAPAGETYTLSLFYRPRGHASWAGTGRSASFHSDGRRETYSYSFDVSAYDAFAYRLAMGGEHSWSQTLPASSCAPGRQVPEAPYSLLLPLSLLGTSGLLLRRRQRLR
jgi:hypothetical protein